MPVCAGSHMRPQTVPDLGAVLESAGLILRVDSDGVTCRSLFSLELVDSFLLIPCFPLFPGFVFLALISLLFDLFPFSQANLCFFCLFYARSVVVPFFNKKQFNTPA